MTGLSGVTEVRVPGSVVREAETHLRTVGRRGLEGFALWAGAAEGSVFRVSASFIPKQTGHRLPEGVCVIVAGEELHRLNVWLYEHRLTLIAQLHSHPTEAYHSATDDAYPIVTTVGGVSIVVPNFARSPFSVASSAIFRLQQAGGWRQLRVAEASRLIRIQDS